MLKSSQRSKILVAGAAALFIGLGLVQGAEPDPKDVTYKLPDQIQWRGSPGGPQQAILAGRSIQARSVRPVDQMAAAPHEPPAFP